MTTVNKKLIDETVLELHEKGYSAARIGLYLKETYFITCKEKLTRTYPFLQDAELEKKDLELKRERLKSHFEKNKKDYKAKRALVKKTTKLYHATVAAEARTKKKLKLIQSKKDEPKLEL